MFCCVVETGGVVLTAVLVWGACGVEDGGLVTVVLGDGSSLEIRGLVSSVLSEGSSSVGAEDVGVATSTATGEGSTFNGSGCLFAGVEGVAPGGGGGATRLDFASRRFLGDGATGGVWNRKK